MKVGDTLESASWLTGKETPEILKRWEARINEAIDELCYEMGYEHGPVTFCERKPGEERVPEVPDEIAGPDVRLLVAEAEVTAKVHIRPNSFIGDLEHKDLERLRGVTERKYAESFPDRPPLTPEQCDAIIDEMGPDAAYDAVRHATELN